jgi:hypothetical protein
MSLIEFTKTIRGVRHPNGSSKALSCQAVPKPGPDVRESPSFWYFAWPIAFNRFASVSA